MIPSSQTGKTRYAAYCTKVSRGVDSKVDHAHNLRNDSPRGKTRLIKDGPDVSDVCCRCGTEVFWIHTRPSRAVPALTFIEKVGADYWVGEDSSEFLICM